LWAAYLLGCPAGTCSSASFGSASFPLFACFLGHGHRTPFFIAVQVAVALLLIAKHHQNIGRLIAGTESRLGANKTA
jgi:glycerol-3-phosphate acyltransferase PlsY